MRTALEHTDEGEMVEKRVSSVWRKLVFLTVLLLLASAAPLHNQDSNLLTTLPGHFVYYPPKVHSIRTMIKEHASRYSLHGIDVARYQRNIDWNMVSQTGIDFAFIKATEGVGLVDSFFTYNWSEARKYGIKRGAYHYFIAEKDPAIQAVHFIVNTPMDTSDLPPVLDVETDRGQPGWIIRGGMRKWLALVEKAYGKKPIIYSNKQFYDKYLAGYFENYPLWIADYRGDKAEYSKYEQWKFWQHTDEGRLDGVQAKLDFNVFRGSRQQLDSLCSSRIISLKADSGIGTSSLVSRGKLSHGISLKGS